MFLPSRMLLAIPCTMHGHPCMSGSVGMSIQMSLLINRFSISACCAGAEEESLVVHSGDRLPGSSLALSMSELWQVIKEQRDLNLPAHKVHMHLPGSISLSCHHRVVTGSQGNDMCSNTLR